MNLRQDGSYYKNNGGCCLQDCRPWISSHAWPKNLWSGHWYKYSASILCCLWEDRRTVSGHRENSAALTARTKDHLDTVRLHRIIRDSTGIDIPYNKMHQILGDENLASEHSKKSKRRKWVRFDHVPIRTPCGTQITRCSMTADGSCVRTTHHDLSRVWCLWAYRYYYRKRACRAWGGHKKLRQTCICNDWLRISVLWQCLRGKEEEEEEEEEEGTSIFEKKLAELGIKQILAGLRDPLTNGKLERLHGKIQRKLPEFEAVMMRKSILLTCLWNDTTTGDCTHLGVN